MISDVPLGAFLSGGIDSSTIVALMQSLSGQKVKTYTIGFEEAGFDEAAYARKVAAHLGTDHHEMYVTERDALALIPQLPAMYDEPFADISALPTALVSAFARRDVTVALSGDGGDEMLGGYNRHIEAPRLWNAIRPIPKPLRQFAASMLRSVPVAAWDKILPMKPQSGNAMHKLATIMRQEGESGVYESLISHWHDQETPGADRPALDDLPFAERMMLWDTLSYLPNDILVKVDRASMSYGLEARAPLLDRRVFEFVWRLPLSYKIRGGTGKYLLRQVLQKHVPSALFERPKQGFSMPVADWLRGELRDWAENLLSVEALSKHGLLEPEPIRAAWAEHLAGRGQHETRLWVILMFQIWYNTWMEGKS